MRTTRYILESSDLETHLLLREEFLNFTFHGRVPVVLDGVIGASREELGNLSPPVTEALVCVEDDAIFILRPRFFPYVRVQMIVPPLQNTYTTEAGDTDTGDR